MKFNSIKPLSFVIYLDIAFVMMLSLSGAISGIMSTMLYFLAFLVPAILGFYFTKAKNNTLDFLSECKISSALPLVAPTLAGVMALAFVTTAIISAITGKTNAVDLGDSLFLAILTHAVLPAILEEALFRYIPMRAMRDEKPLAVIIYTSVLFALIHHSFFSLPYAFLAGVAFMAIDLMVGSVWPSVIIHLINNTLSVLWYFYGDSSIFVTVVLSLLLALVALSFVVIIKRRKYYTEKIRELFSSKDCKFEIPGEAWILIIPMLLISILELIL